MTFVKEWNQKAFIAKVSGQVLSGMDKACQFAAGQAKSRVRKRTGLLEGEIDYEVRPERGDVVGYVGVRAESGRSKAFYGYIIEVGGKGHPAHPFLRPAVFENGAEITRLITEG